MTLKYIMPAAHPLLLTALISIVVVSSAFQQAPSIIVRSSRRSSSPHLQLQFHHHRREHNTCSYSSALHQSFYDDDANDDDYYYDEFDDSDGWYNDNDGMLQQQYNNNNVNTQFPPPPYDRPPYSSNLRNNIASSSSSPYDNPSWTKSSRYGNRNVNFNSRSNRVNTFDYLPRGTATANNNDRYTPRYGYGRETYRNSRPPSPPSVVDNAMNDVMPNDEYYNNNNNESPSPFSLNQLSRKLYRDYDYDDDPNSSTRNSGGPSRFQGRNINNSNNNSPYQRPSESSRYRDYDDVNYAYTRSYRNDNDQDGARSGNFRPPPRAESQYRDYDDINYAPSRSYRREEGPIMNGNSRTVDDDNNNRSKYTKFPPPPPPPPPPRRRRSQSIPNNFAPPQSNRSDSPRINFPPGVGGSMGYTPPSEYIPQNNNNNNGRVGGGGGRSSRTPPPPPRPPPQRPPPRPPQYRYNNNNNKQKYQYDINRQEKYIDDDELRRSQTQYNFPNGETIRNERINTLRPIGFNSIFSDMFTPFTQMFRSASQSLQSSDMLKEARLRIVEDEVIQTKLGEPLEVSPPFSQSSSMSSVTTNSNGRQNENKSSTKVRARFQVGGPYGTGVATMDSVDGMIRSLVVDVNGVTVRIGPRQKKNGGGSSRNGNRRKNVVEAEILDE